LVQDIKLLKYAKSNIHGLFLDGIA